MSNERMTDAEIERIADLHRAAELAAFAESKPEAVRIMHLDTERALRQQQAEITELRMNVIAFCVLWAGPYAKDMGLPDGHLHPTHYDILQKAGARMTGFTRSETAP